MCMRARVYVYRTNRRTLNDTQLYLQLHSLELPIPLIFLYSFSPIEFFTLKQILNLLFF